jgi:sporulation protein YhbH
MTVVGESGLPRDAGRRDALHHRERVRRKIAEHLKEHIGEEDIIAAGPEKKIRVPVKGTKRWQFILDRGQGGGVGQGDGEPGDVLGPPGGLPAPGAAGTEPGEELYEVWLDMDDVEELLFSELELPRLKPKADADATAARPVYNDLARVGPRLDKKATLRENLLRNAKRGRTSLGGIEKSDLRYLSYRETPKPRHKAVAFLAMDVSGSMTVDRKRMARLFFYWCVQFLRSRYDQTELVFVAHTTEAREVTETEFFGRVESGGTRVSSAFELIGRIQRERYPPEDWNIYILHVSDGDNFAADNARTLELIERAARDAALVGYLEVDPAGGSRAHKLSAFFEREAGELDSFVFAGAVDDRELWPALKRFFAKDDVQAAVR